MTTITTPTRPTRSTAWQPVRRVLHGDAALCAVSGAVALLGARPLADLADLDGGGPVAAVGAFLLLLGADLALLARAGDRLVRRLNPWSAAGDLAWVAASLVVAVTVDMSGVGRALVLAQALVVAGVAIAKATAHRQAVERTGRISA